MDGKRKLYASLRRRFLFEEVQFFLVSDSNHELSSTFGTERGSVFLQKSVRSLLDLPTSIFMLLHASHACL